MLVFCDKCGGIMEPVKSKSGKVYLVCRRCGRKIMKAPKSFKITEKSKKEENVIVSEPKEMLPKTQKMCPKCGNQEAFYWVQQTRSMDEPPTQFFKCTKCGYIWREY